jgi:glycosyltransferase involved in cell wall biosynthesis
LGHYPKSNIFGGVARVVYSLAHELSKQNCELVFYRKKRYSEVFKKKDCHKEDNLTICDVSHLGLAIKLIRYRYDIINVHNPSSFFIIPLILRKLRIIKSKVIFVSHGLVPIEKCNQMYNYPPRYFIYQSICLKWSDHIIAVSNYLKSSIINEYNIEESKISVVHNGVEDKFLTEGKTNSNVSPSYILFAGTITKIKGLDYLLSGLQKIDNFGLIMIGEKTKYLEELENDYTDLFKSKKVKYLGKADTQTLISIYSNASFLVLLSRYDSYAMVVLEAMAAGKPVVISENVGSKEIIENGKEGFIVPFGDIDSLVNVLTYLLNNENEVKKMGQLAKQKALKYRWSNQAKEYLKIFEYILFSTD